MKHIPLLIMLFLLLATPAWAQDNDSITLTLVTHDSFNVSEDVLTAFEADTGITVKILRSGDAGQMVNQSILSKKNPLGDVMFGVDNTFLSRALDADLFVSYQSPMLESVPEAFILDDDLIGRSATDRHSTAFHKTEYIRPFGAFANDQVRYHLRNLSLNRHRNSKRTSDEERTPYDPAEKVPRKDRIPEFGGSDVLPL